MTYLLYFVTAYIALEILLLTILIVKRRTLIPYLWHRLRFALGIEGLRVQYIEITNRLDTISDKLEEVVPSQPYHPGIHHEE